MFTDAFLVVMFIMFALLSALICILVLFVLNALEERKRDNETLEKFIEHQHHLQSGL